jgi:hypothetical protein
MPSDNERPWYEGPLVSRSLAATLARHTAEIAAVREELVALTEQTTNSLHSTAIAFARLQKEVEQLRQDTLF